MFLRSLLLICAIIGPVLADNTLHLNAPQLDRPTLTTLGVQLLITGDDNYNASVTMRYRKAGSTVWRNALPLFRVRPDLVVGWTVPPSFAGSIFDLRPSTTYEIELHATDPDGPVDQVFNLTATTRAVPGYPAKPNYIDVSDAQTFSTVIGNLKAGDVVTLADGVYNGVYFEIHGEGTADNPIIVRGASREGTILDGGNDAAANVLEVYGSFIHVERLTLRNCLRALRFQTQGAEGDVVRNVHIKDVNWAIAPQPGQKDFYIADNIVEGRLAWPLVYSDNNGLNSDDDGIRVSGNGHVVAHNLILGFGDAMKVSQDGTRAVDFYGNEILWTYDNGIELDGSEGNVRCFRNRFTNTFATLSVQPIHGGPAYLIRNVVINAAWEQMKFHALASVPPEEPVGVFAWHNTFVSPGVPLNLQTSSTSHQFAIENNLFVGPAPPVSGEVMDWTGVVDNGIFDYNGYFPNGIFAINLPAQGGYKHYSNFAALQAVGLETHGVILAAPVFASGLVPPASYTVTMQPADVTSAVGSNAVDRGLVLPNINDGFTGAGPDLGAVETGCPLVLYGTRTAGIDESNEPFGCGPVSLKVGHVFSGSFYQGQTGAAYSIRVSNIGGTATTGVVTVTDTLPASLTPTAITGGGWSCTLVPLACNRSDALAPGGVYPDIVVTFQVAASAPATTSITAMVSGGGDLDTNTSVDTIAISPAVAVTIGTAPTGFAFIADGLAYSTASTFRWLVGSLHSLSVVTSQTVGGMRGVFGGWSNGVANASQTITVPLTDTTYNATFGNLQYNLTSAVYPSAAGDVTNGWYNANTSVAVTATAGSGYQFHHFSGDLSGTTNPQNLTISSPKYVVANFTAVAPSLSARITGKTGPDNARIWTLQLVNVGAGPANDARFTGLTFTQTYGVACSPAVSVLTPMPALVGTLAPLNGSGTVAVTLNFGGCPAGARFTLTAYIQANGGTYTASSTLTNQIR